MDEVLMIPKQEFNQLMQFYKGQLLEDPLLERSAHLAVQQHQLLTNPAIPPGQKKALVKPLGNELYHMRKKLTPGQSAYTDEEDKPPPAFAKYSPPSPPKKKKKKPRKSVVDQLRPLPGWEDWAQGRPKKRVRKQAGGAWLKKRKNTIT